MLYDLEQLVFCNVKFFDSDLPENDMANVYMEREWRTQHSILFALPDIRRVFIPEAYGAQFRRDFPDYYGQVSFLPAA